MQYVTLTNWWPYYQAMGGALLLAALSLQLPKMAGAIMSGSTALSAGESAAATIGAAAGVAALGAGAMAGGAAMAGGMGGMASGAGQAMAGVQDFLGGMRGGSMTEFGSKGGSSAAGRDDTPYQPSSADTAPPAPGEAGSGGAPDMESQIKGDAERVEKAQAQGGDVIGAADKRARQPAPSAGDASTASIGGAGKPDTPNQPSAPRVGLHDRLKQVESYMPADGAQGSVQIDHRTQE